MVMTGGVRTALPHCARVARAFIAAPHDRLYGGCDHCQRARTAREALSLMNDSRDNTAQLSPAPAGDDTNQPDTVRADAAVDLDAVTLEHLANVPLDED